MSALCMLPNIVHAQRSEVGVSVGGAFYLGDLNTKKLFHNTKLAGGLYYRYNINTRWAFKFGLTYGRLTADDKSFDNPRNFNFRNDIFDVSAQMEVNFLKFFIGSKKNRVTPYLTAGVAVFFMNPMGYYFDPTSDVTKWVSLQKLHTEGQGLTGYEDVKQYSLSQFAIPFGLGLKWSLGKRVALGVEWTMRLTFTDYIDDVSGFYADPGRIMSEYGSLAAYFSDPAEVKYETGARRGDLNTFDWYSFAVITISIKLGNPKEFCPATTPSVSDRLKRNR